MLKKQNVRKSYSFVHDFHTSYNDRRNNFEKDLF